MLRLPWAFMPILSPQCNRMILLVHSILSQCGADSGNSSLMSRIYCLRLRSEARSDLLKMRLENKGPSNRSPLYFPPAAICPLLLPTPLHHLKPFPRYLSRKRPWRIQKPPAAGVLRGLEMSNGSEREDGLMIKEMCLCGERPMWTG